ncbi:hypothetical protein [Micromonospora sp. WMMD812]|uniref:hypothetical protein n=1 Tax=Micromonospora sp. WMMD812 TaxID=3015152 RepID=UPI00248AD6CC|nr:hypothetical protein [Micromonospora sp. WMMD812]WBB67392.1 hypothetical protein O7603_30590 [Micromonospora sp. WMMD812]
MTRAPANLLAARSLLLTHLNVDKNTVRDSDLEPAEVGIVGDSAHRGGYHCGSDRVVTNDYSVVESPRDRAGLTLDAAALDVGQFSVRAGGGTHTLRSFSTWCVGQCAANAADTRDIREIIYSPDGRTVRRWDRLARRSSGDDSHLWHTHFSFFRDSIKAGRDQTPLFRRYLTTIGLLEDDMAWTAAEKDQVNRIEKYLTRLDGREPIGQAYLRLAVGKDDVVGSKPVSHPTLTSLAAQITALQQALTALAGRDFTDEPAIIQAVLAGLTPEKIAAAIPPTLAKQVAEELARRLAA